MSLGSLVWSGLVDWPLAFLFIVGGALGGLFGIRLVVSFTSIP
jgi:uncharacterized membrane protein YfcA